MHHPWRELRDSPATARSAKWTLQSGHLTCWATRTITLDKGLLQAERRSTLAHELEHVRRGPVPEAYWPREEITVEVEAARRMIDLHDLGEALAWGHSLHEVADELWVDVELVQARLDHLTSNERAYLRRRLGEG